MVPCQASRFASSFQGNNQQKQQIWIRRPLKRTHPGEGTPQNGWPPFGVPFSRHQKVSLKQARCKVPVKRDSHSSVHASSLLSEFRSCGCDRLWLKNRPVPKWLALVSGKHGPKPQNPNEKGIVFSVWSLLNTMETKTCGCPSGLILSHTHGFMQVHLGLSAGLEVPTEPKNTRGIG